VAFAATTDATVQWHGQLASAETSIHQSFEHKWKRAPADADSTHNVDYMMQLLHTA